MADDATSSGVFRYAMVGDLKIISFVSDATVAEGNTIDLGSDSAGGKINTILNTLIQSTVGADKTTTWDPATGIITLGTNASGIENLTIIGV